MSGPEERWSITCIVPVPTFDRNGVRGLCHHYAEDRSFARVLDIMVRHLVDENDAALVKDYGKHSFPLSWDESPMLHIRHLAWRDVP